MSPTFNIYMHETERATLRRWAEHLGRSQASLIQYALTDLFARLATMSPQDDYNLRVRLAGIEPMEHEGVTQAEKDSLGGGK